MSAPKLCVVTEGPCGCGDGWVSNGDGTESPCRARGCNGDGTRSVYATAPEGSVLLTAEQARTAREAVAYVLDGCWAPQHDKALQDALDALGVDR